MNNESFITVTVSSWTQLVDQLYLDSWDAGIGRFRSPFVFRGMPNAACDLSTTLIRAGEGYEDISKLEGHLVRNFRKYAHTEIKPGESVWNLLAMAQHFGVPTRLLDWTYSPFIAMHFTTANLDLYEADGVIWALNHRETISRLPEPLREQADEAGLNVFTAEMLDQVAESLKQLDSLSSDDFVLFLEPPSLNQRIANQFALFSMMSSPGAYLDTWLAHQPELARKIIIPSALKWEVRDKLDQAGITERLLYPGLDGLGRWLKRYYAPNRRHTRTATPLPE